MFIQCQQLLSLQSSLIILRLVLCSETPVISGDLTLHMDDSTDPDARRFSELLETLGLEQHVTFATDISGHWLDLIVTRSSNYIMVISPHPSLFLSDYCFVECSPGIPSTAVTVKEVPFCKWKEINLEGI